MEWSKVKTILICLFSLVNIFLFAMFFKGMYVNTTLEPEVVENTIDILSANNVEIDESVMPNNHSNIKICNVENKYKSVSKMLEAARKISSQNGVDYLSESNVEIKGNTFLCKLNSNESVSNPVRYAKKQMGKTGLLEGIDYSLVEENGYLFFYLGFKDKVFYDSYIRVKADSKGIQEIYGNNWLGDTVTDGGVAESISPAEILIDFSTQRNFTTKVTVESVNQGYYIGDRSETVKVTAFPVWRIVLSNGSEYFYDMRNGDLLNDAI